MAQRLDKKLSPDVEEVAPFQVAKQIHRRLVSLERIVRIPNNEPGAGIFECTFNGVRMNVFRLRHEQDVRLVLSAGLIKTDARDRVIGVASQLAIVGDGDLDAS